MSTCFSGSPPSQSILLHCTCCFSIEMEIKCDDDDAVLVHCCVNKNVSPAQKLTLALEFPQLDMATLQPRIFESRPPSEDSL